MTKKVWNKPEVKKVWNKPEMTTLSAGAAEKSTSNSRADGVGGQKS